MTDADIENIRRQVGELSYGQRSIIPAIDESISVLNVTRHDVAENRQSINELMATVETLDRRLTNVTQSLNHRLNSLRKFLELYLKLDLIIDELKQITQKGVVYLEQFTRQFDTMSLDHVSSCTVTHENLCQILLEIKSKLPSHFILLKDPIREL